MHRLSGLRRRCALAFRREQSPRKPPRRRNKGEENPSKALPKLETKIAKRPRHTPCIKSAVKHRSTITRLRRATGHDSSSPSEQSIFRTNLLKTHAKEYTCLYYAATVAPNHFKDWSQLTTPPEGRSGSPAYTQQHFLPHEPTSQQTRAKMSIG